MSELRVIDERQDVILAGLRVNFRLHRTETATAFFDSMQREDGVGFKTAFSDLVYDYSVLSISYDENPAIGCCAPCCCPNSETCGYHLGDVESLYLLFDAGSDRTDLRYVYFKAHGYGQGVWRRCFDHTAGLKYAQPPKCLYDDETKTLTVYIARSSHAFYPYAGITWRAFGFANDYTNKGVEHSIFLDSLNPTVVDHVPHRIAPVSSTCAQRFFVPCLIDRLVGEALNPWFLDGAL